MNHLIVARKYRPVKFSDISSQEHITVTLQNAIRTGRIAHGYIFSGSRGVGKTTAARILAKALNCEKIISDATFRNLAEPCNNCKSCTDFDEARSLNIFEFDGASNNGVDDIRDLRENVRYAPQHGNYRVFIIDEFHMLTNQAFNAFLKTLEEPPAHAVFILATTELHKVPLTVASRCQKFIFRRIPSEDIHRVLKSICQKEHVLVEDGALALIAQKSDGALRDAQSILEQIISFNSDHSEVITLKSVSEILNTIDIDYFFQVTQAIIEKSIQKQIEIAHWVYENGYDAAYFISELIKHIRNFLICKTVKSPKLIEGTAESKNRYIKESEFFSVEVIYPMIDFLVSVEQDLKYTHNAFLRLELALIKLIDIFNFPVQSNQKINKS
ncbi:hypothetical protein CHS0354_023893 [Potamilus streckersoni]|uniref:DNA-directed DNA polymerase n=1 Tax=Potamilus streckersoni TaxID=2493646 RepID=A0AAE0RZF8_9BIVA|nr:hypothetical protein CHS0354_023893 [Potamilus streckersoni]